MSTGGIIKVSVVYPIFDGHDYPKWKAMMRKRLLAMNSGLWTVTEIGLTDLCKMAHADNICKYTQLDIMAKDIICSCLSSDEFMRIMHLCNAKLIWDRISDVYEGHQTRQDPWFCDFKESLKTMTFKPEPSTPTYCFMARGAKVNSCDAYFQTSSEDDSEFLSKPSYKTLL